MGLWPIYNWGGTTLQTHGGLARWEHLQSISSERACATPRLRRHRKLLVARMASNWSTTIVFQYGFPCFPYIVVNPTKSHIYKWLFPAPKLLSIFVILIFPTVFQWFHLKKKTQIFWALPSRTQPVPWHGSAPAPSSQTSWQRRAAVASRELYLGNAGGNLGINGDTYLYIYI